jgi:hypothetical protein
MLKSNRTVLYLLSLKELDEVKAEEKVLQGIDKEFNQNLFHLPEIIKKGNVELNIKKVKEFRKIFIDQTAEAIKAQGPPGYD